MLMVDRGSGIPIVLVPGIQGRWEWMAPAVRALSARHRALTFSLGEIAHFDDWVPVIDAVLDRAGVSSAVVAGVSFGGLIALHYAAARPERTRALVLVSAPGPARRLDRWSGWLVRNPRLGLPFFSVRGFVRLVPEIFHARRSWGSRLRLAAEYAGRVALAPVSPRRMARHVHAWGDVDLTPDCARISAPTLVITGEPTLDRVVPIGSSLEYLELIRGARHERLDGTGHVGLITRPERFAAVIDRFLTEEVPHEHGDLPSQVRRHAS
jgi:pimeloyl-ACP methyl ester carboxylesterase